MENSSSILLIAILSATFTYHVGLMTPPGCNRHNGGGDPMLLTTRCKAFFYFNSVAFVASLVAVMLVHKHKRVRLEHQALKAAIILQLFGLMGAYAAVSSQDVSISISYVINLAGVLLAYDVMYGLMMYITGERGKIKQELMEMNCAGIFITMFAYATYYEDTLSEAAFYMKSFSFLLLSVVLIILLVTPNLYKRAIKNEPVFVISSLAAAMSFASCEGMTEYMQKDVYIMILVGWTVLFRFFSAENADNDDEDDTADLVNDTTSSLTSPETENGYGNKWDAKDIYIVLLGVLTARVTYKAGLASPFGKV